MALPKTQGADHRVTSSATSNQATTRTIKAIDSTFFDARIRDRLRIRIYVKYRQGACSNPCSLLQWGVVKAPGDSRYRSAAWFTVC